MGKESEKQDIILATTKIFKLIGDPTRFLILHMLENRELNVNAIADELQLEQSAVSHQLRKLREAKLVKSRRIGKNILYSQDDSHVYDILHLAVEHARHGFEEGKGEPRLRNKGNKRDGNGRSFSRVSMLYCKRIGFIKRIQRIR